MEKLRAKGGVEGEFEGGAKDQALDSNPIGWTARLQPVRNTSAAPQSFSVSVSLAAGSRSGSRLGARSRMQ